MKDFTSGIPQEDFSDTLRLYQAPIPQRGNGRGEMIWESDPALAGRLQSFENDSLRREEDLAALAAIGREIIANLESLDSLEWRAPDITRGRFRCAARKRRARTTTASSSPATIRCCC